jgi:Sec-independent protein translocase protein TatA
MFELIVIVLVIALVISFFTIAKLEKNIASLRKELQVIKQRVIDIDPQFDDERALQSKFQAEYETDKNTLSGMAHSQLVTEKEAKGKPTLFNPF